MKTLEDILENLNSEINELAIKVEHPGVLEVPHGKNFWDLPIAHFKSLMSKKGAQTVMRALLNLERWNSEKNPDISAKARKIINAIKEKD